MASMAACCCSVLHSALPPSRGIHALACHISCLLATQAKLFVDFHGRPVARHVADKRWSPGEFVLALRERQLSWRRIFWKMWGITHSLRCQACGLLFMCAALGHCRYHPTAPVFEPGENEGRYVCVGGGVC